MSSLPVSFAHSIPSLPLLHPYHLPTNTIYDQEFSVILSARGPNGLSYGGTNIKPLGQEKWFAISSTAQNSTRWVPDLSVSLLIKTL